MLWQKNGDLVFRIVRTWSNNFPDVKASFTEYKSKKKNVRPDILIAARSPFFHLLPQYKKKYFVFENGLSGLDLGTRRQPPPIWVPA